MDKIIEKVKRQLETGLDKGISTANVEMLSKLADIYKDIKEGEYYEKEAHGDSYDARRRDSMGRYMGDYDMYMKDYDRGSDRNGYNNRGYNSDGYWTAEGRYGHYPLDEKTERYFTRMREGMERYNVGKDRYRNGETQDRMVDGIDMTMAAICMFIESLCDFAETPQEKEVIRKHIDKMKKI